MKERGRPRARRDLAALAYVPVPGAAWLVARAAPRDRLVRHHARQGGLLALLLWVVAMGLGFLLPVPSLEAALSVALGTLVGFALAATVAGVASAARGRYLRLRPLWDLWAFSGRAAPRSPPT